MLSPLQPRPLLLQMPVLSAALELLQIESGVDFYALHRSVKKLFSIGSVVFLVVFLLGVFLPIAV